METQVWVFLGVVVTAFFTYLGTRKPKSDSTMVLVDQLQEEVASLRAEMKSLREQVAHAEDSARTAKKEAYETQDKAKLQLTIMQAYVYELRAHVAAGNPPPPPSLPPEIESMFTKP